MIGSRSCVSPRKESIVTYQQHDLFHTDQCLMHLQQPPTVVPRAAWQRWQGGGSDNRAMTRHCCGERQNKNKREEGGVCGEGDRKNKQKPGKKSWHAHSGEEKQCSSFNWQLCNLVHKFYKFTIWSNHLTTIIEGLTSVLSISIFLIISIFGIFLSTKYNFHGSTSYLHQYEILKMSTV